MSKLYLMICLSLVLVSLRAESEFSFQYTTKIIEGEEYIQTPFGLMLKVCVKNVPSYTLAKEFQKVIDVLKEILPRTTRIGIDNTGYSLSNGLTLKQSVVQYSVHNNPQTKNNQTLFYFIGSQNQNNYFSGSGYSIIQPVLTYHNGWYLQYWNFYIQCQAVSADPVYGVNPQDTIYGSIINLTSKQYNYCYKKAYINQLKNSIDSKVNRQLLR
ncbi:hypothetical protein ABPG72_012151, partial [Tetrahymena utriculariae]